MLETYPRDLGQIDRAKLVACIDACIECDQACTACADACLSEDDVNHLTKCVRTCLDCADVCSTSGRVLSRHTGYDANLTRTVLKHARPPVRQAQTSVTSMRRNTSIAACAPTYAVAANGPAATFLRRSVETTTERARDFAARV